MSGIIVLLSALEEEEGVGDAEETMESAREGLLVPDGLVDVDG